MLVPPIASASMGIVDGSSSSAPVLSACLWDTGANRPESELVMEPVQGPNGLILTEFRGEAKVGL